AGDDLDWNAEGLRSRLQELPLILRVAHGAGGYGPDAGHLQLATGRGQWGQRRASGGNRVFADESGAEDAFSEARHLSVGGQHPDGGLAPRPGESLGGLHAYGVAANVDRRISGHRDQDTP